MDWGCIRCGGVIFSLFLPSGVRGGVFPGSALSTVTPGTRHRLSLSWCTGGELVVGVSVAVVFLGAGVVEYVFALDMV